MIHFHPSAAVIAFIRTAATTAHLMEQTMETDEEAVETAAEET